uniref:DnaJ homolog subfamily C member 10 n=1 Tax=Scleropages formosus TaxID=113540 RepID=A0A8C9TUT0_SCLFO
SELYSNHCTESPLVVSLTLYLACLLDTVSTGEDYYQLLGLSKDASTREIRQAFKKLALVMHPDKNPNDESAHEKFLKINRAYEVLKDEELRRKYDKYGERGLQDSQQGGRYESWNFYRYDFGIYDEDLEIITLDWGDFDAAVNSGELWFVNFYFPRCSHCHELAPTWRQFAKEMDGVFRIGAVNCGDNGRLCRSKGVSSYPSLYVFRAGMSAQKYFGDRSKESLVSFAMQFVSSKVTELWEDCLESQTRQKLAGMLEGLVSVGWLDCSVQAELCERLHVTSSFTAYSPPGSSLEQRDHMLLIHSLDVKEIYSEVIQYLPDLESLTQDTFTDKLENQRWLVSFTFGQKNLGSIEYRKLQVLLKEASVKVGQVDCLTESRLCDAFYIQKPSIAVFKDTGVNDFEVYHGKELLYNVVGFAKDSANAHVTTLLPRNFPRNEKEPWLVDFFAPWCPPCRALLPELRKASVQLFGQLKFGTLDCTIHEGLCRTVSGRHSTGTRTLQAGSGGSLPGHINESKVLKFIEYDLVNPVVVPLTPDNFDELVRQRRPNETWTVDFYAPWCGPCQALLPEWRRMARMVNGIVKVGTVDCQKYHWFCQQESVRAYPEIRLFPQDSRSRNHYESYNGWHRDAHSLRAWALGSLPRVSVDLNPEDFKQMVLRGRDHWVLDFYAPWCGPCQHFAPEFELLARVLQGTVRAGKLDCQAHGETCQSVGIRAYPTVRFYPYLGSNKVRGGAVVGIIARSGRRGATDECWIQGQNQRLFTERCYCPGMLERPYWQGDAVSHGPSDCTLHTLLSDL